MDLDSANLALRFLLELAALATLASWGWTTHTGLARIAWAIGLPLVAAAIWGVFRVPDDPGPSPVPVPGPVRLALELALLGGAAWLLSAAGRPAVALVLGALIALHYLASYDRVIWLLSRR